MAREDAARGGSYYGLACNEVNGFVFDFVAQNFEIIAVEKLVGHRRSSIAGGE